MNQRHKDEMVRFVEWVFYNCTPFPDGWHYNGIAYSSHEILEIFLNLE